MSSAKTRTYEDARGRQLIWLQSVVGVDGLQRESGGLVIEESSGMKCESVCGKRTECEREGVQE